MTIKNINVGNIPNDGSGDDLREAFIKVNDNFVEVDNRISTSPIEGENLGVSGEGVFAGKDNNTLQFKEILAGENVNVSSNSSSIIIDSSGGLNDFLVLTDNGSLTIDGSAPFGIQGGDLIETRSPGSTLFISLKSSGILEHDTTPKLSNSLEANNKDIQNAGVMNANSFNGPLNGLVYGVDIRNINRYFGENWDFGGITNTFDNIIEYIIFQNDVDLGSFTGTNNVSEVWDIDLGSF